MSHFTHFYFFYWFSSVIHEKLIFHNVSEKVVRTIHTAKISTSFLRPEQGVRFIYGCGIYMQNYGIWVMGEVMTEQPSLINFAEIPSKPVGILVLTVFVYGAFCDRRMFKDLFFGIKTLPVFY